MPKLRLPGASSNWTKVGQKYKMLYSFPCCCWIKVVFNLIICSGWTEEDGTNWRPIEQTQCWRLLFEGAWCRTGAGEEYAQEGNKDTDKGKDKNTDKKRQRQRRCLLDLVTLWLNWLFLTNWETQIVTLRVSDRQSQSDLAGQHSQFLRCFFY